MRKSRNGRALKLDISVQNVLDAVRYTGKNGQEYVGLVINMSTLLDVLEGRRVVTGVNQITLDGDEGNQGNKEKKKDTGGYEGIERKKDYITDRRKDEKNHEMNDEENVMQMG